MLALVVILLVVTMLLAVVTAGLLRSHADILRALHEIGVGVGDPAGVGDVGRPAAAADPSGVALRLGVGATLPAGRASASIHDLVGVSPGGDAVVASMAAAPLTLLAFLSSGCASCAGFWSALGDPVRLELLPAGIRVVVVTKGPEWESPDAIAARAPRGVPVIMSTAAWSDYEVPGSPFFALVDGSAGVRVGEGVGADWEQVADLVQRAEADVSGGRSVGTHVRPPARIPGRSSGGDEREAANDVDLRAAGITPGHPSLYPRRLQEVFLAADPHAGRGPTTPAGGLMARLAAMGIEVDLVDGWEGRIYRRDPAGLERTCPVTQLATFALPAGVADFGGGLPAAMGPTDIFAVLFEYGPESLAAPLFAAPGLPRRLSGSDFHPYTLRRGVAGQSGTQRFFTEQQRPFTLYVVLGRHALRDSLVARVNRVLDRVSIHPATAGSAARHDATGL